MILNLEQSDTYFTVIVQFQEEDPSTQLYRVNEFHSSAAVVDSIRGIFSLVGGGLYYHITIDEVVTPNMIAGSIHYFRNFQRKFFLSYEILKSSLLDFT